MSKFRVPAISGLNLHGLESREFIGEGSSPKSSSEVQTPGTKDMNHPTREMGFICPVKKPHPIAHRMETGKQKACSPLIANHLLPMEPRKPETECSCFLSLFLFSHNISLDNDPPLWGCCFRPTLSPEKLSVLGEIPATDGGKRPGRRFWRTSRPQRRTRVCGSRGCPRPLRPGEVSQVGRGFGAVFSLVPFGFQVVCFLSCGLKRNLSLDICLPAVVVFFSPGFTCCRFPIC